MELLHGHGNFSGDPGTDLLFHLNFSTYGTLWLFTAFLALGSVILIILRETRLRQCSEMVPESCILILLGILAAVLSWGMGILRPLSQVITYEHFFNFLLPPIILDASYQLYCKPFLMNLDGILVLAVVGTSLNVFIIGGLLHLCYGMTLAKCLLLASIVSAVDPVAVLAVFQEIGVQANLYFLIFGESLFNDGVTVVYFDTLDKIAFVNVQPLTYLYAVLSFFTVSLGGLLIGMVFGAITALCCSAMKTKKVLEPSVVFTLAYLAFTTAQMFHWSGILALIGVGLTQRRYAFVSMSPSSVTVVEANAKILAIAAETIIFLILGFNVLKDRHLWDWTLIGYTILFCVVVRFVVTFSLGYLLNLGRLHRLSMSHLFMMSFGGLRGAVSFAMAASVKHNEVRDVFMTTTLSVILFTVFLQGVLIKPLVNYFHFQARKPTGSFTGILAQNMSFHILAGIEALLLGGGFTSIHYWLETLEAFDFKYVFPLMGAKAQSNMMRRYAKHVEVNESKYLHRDETRSPITDGEPRLDPGHELLRQSHLSSLHLQTFTEARNITAALKTRPRRNSDRGKMTRFQEVMNREKASSNTLGRADVMPGLDLAKAWEKKKDFYATVQRSMTKWKENQKEDSNESD
ncbi:sodium/hydrogen exchanger 1-like [Tigriopus californicus]|nr:sodium/hydrogen exchanger 1-like [Tigriopus californicus]